MLRQSNCTARMRFVALALIASATFVSSASAQCAQPVSEGDEPTVSERPERAARGRSWLPGRAGERGRRGRLGRPGQRREDVDCPIERDGSGDSLAAHQMSSLDN